MMQKQKKQFIGVIIVLLICIAAYFGLTKYNAAQEEKEAAEEEAATIYATSFDADAITAFSYQVDGTTVSFTKDDDDSWTYDDDTSLDIDEDSISTMLSAVASVTAEEELTDVDDTSDYGFDDPTNVITVTTADGTTTLTIGALNEISSDYYLQNSDSTSIYTITSSLNSSFSSAVDDLVVEEEEDTDETTDTSDTTEDTESTSTDE